MDWRRGTAPGPACPSGPSREPPVFALQTGGSLVFAAVGGVGGMQGRLGRAGRRRAGGLIQFLLCFPGENAKLCGKDGGNAPVAYTAEDEEEYNGRQMQGVSHTACAVYGVHNGVQPRRGERPGGGRPARFGSPQRRGWGSFIPAAGGGRIGEGRIGGGGQRRRPGWGGGWGLRRPGR